MAKGFGKRTLNFVPTAGYNRRPQFPWHISQQYMAGRSPSSQIDSTALVIIGRQSSGTATQRRRRASVTVCSNILRQRTRKPRQVGRQFTIFKHGHGNRSKILEVQPRNACRRTHRSRQLLAVGNYKLRPYILSYCKIYISTELSMIIINSMFIFFAPAISKLWDN